MKKGSVLALILALLLLTACALSYAQEHIVARVVDSQTGDPLPFASVYVSGSNSTITNVEGGAIGVCKSSVACSPDERLIIEGTAGRIVLPHSHVGNEAYLWQRGRLTEHFIDNKTENGFTYEIEEAVRCIREGLTESPVCSHAMTLEFARLCDKIFEAAE